MEILAKGLELHRQGQLDAAERKYLAALKADRRNPDSHYLLGILRLECGDASRAAGHLRDAITAAEKAGRKIDHGWQLALGSALQQSGDHTGALTLFDAVLRAAPGSIDALFCRATVLQALGRLAEAIPVYEKLLGLAPNHAEAANNLGVAYSEAGRPADAIRAFRMAVQSRPDYVEALCNLGSALANRGEAYRAVSLLRRAAATAADSVDLQLVFFECLIEANLVDEVEQRARALLPKHSGNAEFVGMMGSALQFQGKNEEALECFRKAVALDVGCSRAQQGLADLEEAGESGDSIRQLRVYLDDSINDTANPGLWFALANRYRRAGRSEDAFDAFMKANQLRRTEMDARGYGYDRARREAEVTALLETYPAGSLDVSGASESEMPVFIVGMPRSGTTLIEQILASHPAVFGAGELGHIQQAAGMLPGRGNGGNPDALAEIAQRYLAILDDRSGGGAQRVTDKMPQNFSHLGLISRLFPKARIIHCRRDPMDSCLSCFEQNFRAGGLSWSCDLGDTGHYYCQYSRLMEHWRAVLHAGRMLEIDYEETVADLEAQARRIVGFIGLPWDDACLAFHEADRAVVTASRSQVRNPVYSSSVGRWRRYGEGVVPLVEALKECGCGPES